MVYLLNIGNTNVQRAWCDNGVISNISSIPTAELKREDLPHGCDIAVATVVPRFYEEFAGMERIFFLTRELDAGVDFDTLVDSSTLGSDRLANAVELAYSYELPALCIDFGTAITIEAVDAFRRFAGGTISPGRMLMRNALHDYTAQLPLLKMRPNLPPADPWGTNTVYAMEFGIDHGALGMVKELISCAQEKMQMPIKTIIGVGGDYEFFAPHLKNVIAGGKDFTLRGLYRSWELSKKCV